MVFVLSLAALLLLLFGNGALLWQVRQIQSWSQRRMVQLVVLGMPLFVLVLHLCMLGLLSWRLSVPLVLLLGMAVSATIAVVLALLRLLVLLWTMRHHSHYASVSSRTLQAQVERIAQQGQMVLPRMPRVRLATCQQPLAFTYGFRRPTIVLSCWMVNHLDARELEAVLTHELTHVVRQDALVLWLAQLLRDAFFYLPTSWLAYRQLQQEKELACDELAALQTHRPLALAGALTKVWLQTLDNSIPPAQNMVQPLLTAKVSIQGRIERLLAFSPSEGATRQSVQGAMQHTLQMLLTMGTIYVSYCLLMLMVMQCAPTVLLQRLF